MDEDNPYEAPKAFDLISGPEANRKGRWAGWLRYGWVLASFLNLPVPALLAWGMTEKSGRIGVALGFLSLVAIGHAVCSRGGRFGKALLVGSFAMAISQIVPIAQLVAGIVGTVIGILAGQVTDDDMGHYEIQSEPGGFLVTTVTGSGLVMAAVAADFAIRAVTPERWWADESQSKVS